MSFCFFICSATMLLRVSAVNVRFKAAITINKDKPRMNHRALDRVLLRAPKTDWDMVAMIAAAYHTGIGLLQRILISEFDKERC